MFEPAWGSFLKWFSIFFSECRPVSLFHINYTMSAISAQCLFILKLHNFLACRHLGTSIRAGSERGGDIYYLNNWFQWNHSMSVEVLILFADGSAQMVPKQRQWSYCPSRLAHGEIHHESNICPSYLFFVHWRFIKNKSLLIKYLTTIN